MWCVDRKSKNVDLLYTLVWIMESLTPGSLYVNELCSNFHQTFSTPPPTYPEIGSLIGLDTWDE